MKMNVVRIGVLALVSSVGLGTLPGFAQAGVPDWGAPPQEFRDVARAGFHDGIEGARRDYENHRRPDVNNRDEYRHPHVRGRDRDEYRRGFERGYQVGVSHFYGHR